MSEDNTPRRVLRERKEVDYTGKEAFSLKPVEEPAPTLPAGKGTKLSELTCWKSIKDADLAYIHRIVIGRPGQKGERKGNLADFCGLDPKTDRAKLETRVAGARKEDVVFSLSAFGLKHSGSLKDLAPILVDFLMSPSGKRGPASPKKQAPAAAKRRKTNSGGKKKADDASDDEAQEEEESPKKKAPAAKKAAPKQKKSSPKKRSKEEAEDEDADEADVELPSDDAVKKWVFEFLRDKSDDEIANFGIKALRAAGDTHFGLPEGSLKEKKDVVKDAISAFLTKRSAGDATASPKVSPKKPAETASPKASPKLSPKKSPKMSPPPIAVLPTPEPSVAQPDSALPSTNNANREPSPSRAAESTDDGNM
eukprot:PhM_4_TR10994/c0_g1_i1/m.29179